MKGFQEYLEEKGLESKTCLQYRRYVGHFLRYYGQDITGLTYADMLVYVGQLQERALSKPSINGHLHALRHYLEMQVKSGILTENPAANLYLKRDTRRVPQNLLDYARLCAVQQRFEGTLRQQVILGLLVFQGLQHRDLRGLEQRDVDLAAGTVFLKGNAYCNPRKLALDASQILPLYRYMQEVGRRYEGYLFNQKNGLTETLFHLMNRVRKRYPAVQKATQIRQTVLVHWLASEDLRTVQYKAGHKYVSSTEHYQQVNLEALQASLQKYHPLY